jgi:hypothetical protein
MDEAEFRQAIRLLHVVRAWAGTPNAAHDPARQDPLYPMKHDSLQQRPLLGAINDLLVKYPYEPISKERPLGTGSTSQPPR